MVVMVMVIVILIIAMISCKVRSYPLIDLSTYGLIYCMSSVMWSECAHLVTTLATP
jgi:hypothetical protein